MSPLSKAIRVALAAMVLPAAQAQTAPAGVTLEPIVVQSQTAGDSYTAPANRSATGLALSVKETPQSVSTVTQQQMRDQNAASVADALNSATGVSVKNFDRGRPAYSARGFTIDKLQIDGMNLNWDPAWVTGETSADSVLFERVEVVRGATGLMNGAGNPSAAVNLVRKHADSRERTTAIEGGVNEEGSWKATIDHTQPFTADGSIRGRFIADHNGGNTFVDRERNRETTLYAVLDADITPNTKAAIGISHQIEKKDDAMWGGLPAFFDDGGETDWAIDKNASADWVYWHNKTTNIFAEGEHAFNDDWKISAKVNHRIGNADDKLFYPSGNSIDRNTGLGLAASPGKFDVNRKQTNLQLQADGKFRAWGQEHDVVIGAGHSRTANHSLASTIDYNAQPNPGSFFTWNGNYPEPAWGAMNETYRQTINESALYAATRLRATDKLSVIAGGRVSNWESKGISYGSSLDYKPGTVFTPYAGILYDITPDHTVYASYTDIFKPQNNRDINNKLLDPIRGAAYEIGWKGSFLNGNLNTQAALFQTRQDNLAQSTSEKIPGVVPETTAYRAAKGAKVHGFELEATGNVTENLRLSAGYSQWRGKDAEGKPINTNHPRKQLKAFAAYDLPAVEGLTLGAGVQWQSRSYVSAAHRPTNRSIEYGQGSYATVDVMARYQINKNFSAQLNVDNLFNKKYRNQFGFGQYAYGDPRQISATFRYEF